MVTDCEMLVDAIIHWNCHIEIQSPKSGSRATAGGQTETDECYVSYVYALQVQLLYIKLDFCWRKCLCLMN